MKINEVINIVRNDKRLTIAEAIGKDMSRSTYNRYINGENDLYNRNFLALLSNLKITFEEIQFISSGYAGSKEAQISEEIKKAFLEGNVDQLNYFRILCKDEYEKNHDIFYFHTESLIDILLARLQLQDIDIRENSLYKYLIKTETWTRYELVMFNNSFFYFSVEAVKTVLPRAINKLRKYRKLNPYANEGFRLIINAVIFFMKNDEYREAIQTITIMESYNLTEEQVFERLFLQFFSGIKLVIVGNTEGFEQIKKSVEFMGFLGLDNLETMSEDLVLDIESISL